MPFDNTQIRVRAIIGDDFHDTIRLLFSKLAGNPYKRMVLHADHWEELPEGAYVVPDDHEHGVRIPKQAAQAIMDDLWQIGMRPSNYQDVVGTMQRHLDHMNTLAEWQHQQIVTLTEAALKKSE